MTTETTDQATYLDKTRQAYDIAAGSYAEIVPPLHGRDPYGIAMLRAFADQVRAESDAGPVADLGCGPGHVTAQLRDLGLDAFGIDLSPRMIAEARRAHPDLRFEEGSMTALDLADDSLGGLVAWYSTVHTPAEVLPVLFAEFHRVLAPEAGRWSRSRWATCSATSTRPTDTTSIWTCTGARRTRSPRASKGQVSPSRPASSTSPTRSGGRTARAGRAS